MKTYPDKSSATKEPEVVVFHGRFKKDSTATKKTDDKSAKKRTVVDEDEDKELFSMKKARYDVYKFGIKGLDKEEQENAKVQLAIKLGAAPPKNKCENYKDILKRKSEEKAKKEELVRENRLYESKLVSSKPLVSLEQKNSKGKGRGNKKARINKGNVGHIKGHIGSFSDGVLKLSKFDLKKLNAGNKKK